MSVMAVRQADQDMEFNSHVVMQLNARFSALRSAVATSPSSTLRASKSSDIAASSAYNAVVLLNQQFSLHQKSVCAEDSSTMVGDMAERVFALNSSFSSLSRQVRSETSPTALHTLDSSHVDILRMTRQYAAHVRELTSAADVPVQLIGAEFHSARHAVALLNARYSALSQTSGEGASELVGAGSGVPPLMSEKFVTSEGRRDVWELNRSFTALAEHFKSGDAALLSANSSDVIVAASARADAESAMARVVHTGSPRTSSSASAYVRGLVQRYDQLAHTIRGDAVSMHIKVHRSAVHTDVSSRVHVPVDLVRALVLRGEQSRRMLQQQRQEQKHNNVRALKRSLTRQELVHVEAMSQESKLKPLSLRRVNTAPGPLRRLSNSETESESPASASWMRLRPLQDMAMKGKSSDCVFPEACDQFTSPAAWKAERRMRNMRDFPPELTTSGASFASPSGQLTPGGKLSLSLDDSSELLRAYPSPLSPPARMTDADTRGDCAEPLSKSALFRLSIYRRAQVHKQLVLAT